MQNLLLKMQFKLRILFEHSTFAHCNEDVDVKGIFWKLPIPND